MDNPLADTGRTVSASTLIEFLQREIEQNGDNPVYLCVPYTDGVGFRSLPIKDVHTVSRDVHILSCPV